jgi:phosphohistidine phosphatase
MKTLLLLRHAKSQWPDGVGRNEAARAQALETLDDHARPLTDGGIEAAEKLARSALPALPTPALILCSSATRARQTLAAVRQLTWGGAKVETERGLYVCGPAKLKARLKRVDDGIDTVAIVAHNPDLHLLAQELAVNGKKKLRAALAEKFPTGALAAIVLPIDRWADLEGAEGTLEALVFPKELPDLR